VCAIVLAPMLTYRMGVDQGVFAYMGAELLKGHWPYIATWESDFPGLIFIQAAEMAVLGRSIVMFRLFDCAVQLANAYFVYHITCRVADRAGAFVAAVIFVLIYQGYGPWNTAQREGFALFFILLGFWLYLTAERRRPMTTALGIGLGFGVAVTIKPTLLCLAALYAPLMLPVKRDTIRLGATAAVGLVTPAAVIVVLYWAHGGLRQFYEACVAFQTVYTQLLSHHEPMWRQWLSKLSRLGGTAVGLPLVYLPFVFGGRALRERRMLYLGYLGSVYAVFVQGTFAGYHYLPGLGIGAILVGSMFSVCTRMVLRDGRVSVGRFSCPTQMLVASGVLVAALPVYVRAQPWRDLVSLHFLEPPRPAEFRIGTIFDFTESWNVAEYLRAHTEPDDRIQVWGYECLVYYLADRRAASRFQTSHALVMRVPGNPLPPMQQRWRQEFLRDVNDRPPRYVAVVRNDNWWWAPGEQTSDKLLDDFPEWKQFLGDRYRLDGTIGRFLVYRLAGASSNDRSTESHAG